ncbi:hypothetical protein ISN76_19460 [Dyella halodurans]|uniref:Peptidase M61 catalytic domain-containing protein n=1 Tax=Dyella halodurans TaxID=1920171 RepID=A0ABV9BZW8_9GAMM|nr:hypothetical protein [Dyella halodurans]
MKRIAAAVSAALFCMATGVVSSATAADAPPPNLNLVLKPHAPSAKDGYLGVTMTIQEPKLAAGSPLVRLPLKLVGVPSARYDGDALTATDASGPLPLSQSQEAETPEGAYRRWNVARATKGDVVVSFRAPPRVVTASTNNGPLFDLRSESGGFIGAGVTFMATPVSPGPYNVNLKWDLSDMPAGSHGVWSLGDGDVHAVVPSEVLSFSYYAVGPLKTLSDTPNARLNAYWLSEPPFDAKALGAWVGKLYDYMSRFFGDTDSSYRVFMRQNPYEGTGGTALAHSFMFGYYPPAKPTLEELKSLLSHEMAHTWPSLDGTHGETAWYSEGTAEYYSLLLAYRAGLLSIDEYLKSINDRAAGYYASPSRHMRLDEVAKLFWKDPAMQKDPYGRGFLYLVQTNEAIKAKSGGKRSLDDVVLELNRRNQRGEPHGVAQWLDLVGKEIGAAEAKRAFDAMASGETLVLPPNAFAPCFKVVSQPRHVFELGYVRSNASSDAVVTGLKADSAAARAGLKDGDRIVRAPNISKVWPDDTASVTGVFERDGKQYTATWVPRGAKVDAYQWVRGAGAAPTCKF